MQRLQTCVIVSTDFISFDWLTGNLSIRAKRGERDTIIASVSEDSPGSDTSKEKGSWLVEDTEGSSALKVTFFFEVRLLGSKTANTPYLIG